MVPKCSPSVRRLLVKLLADTQRVKHVDDVKPHERAGVGASVRRCPDT